MKNPYDEPEGCTCGAVDPGLVRAWQEGYDAAKAEVSE